MGRIRLFPLTLAETIGLESLPAQFRRKQTLDYLAHGGMPGLFAVRDEEEREALVQDWLDLTCYRDLQQFKDHKLDGDLAFEILKLSATLEEPTRAAMTKSLRADPRRIETHLKALCALFALQRINPHPSGTGKPIYLLLDAGIAEFLGASRLRRLHIWLMIERMAKNSYNREKRKSFTYYRSSGKKMIHWVEEGIDQNPRAFQLMDEERIRKIDAALMEAFLVKNPSAAGTILAPIPAQQKIGKSQFLPWEELPHLK
jgi:predicted AAA+ superfamily ATPase